MERKFGLPFHPFLLTIFPILSFWLVNRDFIPFSSTWHTLVLYLAAAGLLFGAASLLLRSIEKGAAATSLGAFAFLYFGQVYFSVDAHFPHYTLPIWFSAFWFSIFIFGIYVIVRSAQIYPTFTLFLNLLSIILLIAPVAQTILALRLEYSPMQPSNTDFAELASSKGPSENQPDVYYIILDGYGRQDVLADLYAFDNSGFVNALHQHGFYVADGSHTNYIQTSLSLSSSLSADYLDSSRLDLASRSRIIASTYLNEAASLQNFHNLGYEIVAVRDADELFNLRRADKKLAFDAGFSSFGLGFNRMTLSVFWDQNSYERAGWKLILAQLDALENVPLQSRIPRFFFAHLLIPHPPFSFDARGNFVPTDLVDSGEGTHFGGTKEEYIRGYAGQVEYLNSRLIRILDHLLSDPEHQPIIILQGDHGPGAYLDWNAPDSTCLRERLGILNAYYLPARAQYDRLYSTISPVNSLRIVFSELLQQPIPLLEDRSYYSSWDRPYNFIDVTAMEETCSKP